MSESIPEQEMKTASEQNISLDSAQPYEIQSENDEPLIGDSVPIEQLITEPQSDSVSQQEAQAVTEEEITPSVSQEDAPAKAEPIPINESLAEITAQIRQVAKDFETKLKYDASKQTLIDKLYNENQNYKDGIIKKFQQSMILAVIEQIDDAEKTITHFENVEFSEENFRKLLKSYRDIAESFQDVLLEKFDVSHYRCETETPFDPKRQRSLKTVTTDDQTKHKLVKQSLRPGYEINENVLRQEMVEVYVFNRRETDDGKQEE